ncbi:unnamed protein product [Ceratitis capitata]|uniref:(Mediterranean fruit fly) hypothetical protein n=1 Tax=Ceratitis capitata TaxID=7213 RepID=A0A811V4Y8_CERCA|nr:unnamed protein product [Ceratitis capitata]
MHEKGISEKGVIFNILCNNNNNTANENCSGIVLENSSNDTRNVIYLNTIEADQLPQNSDETRIKQKLVRNIQVNNGEEATTKYPKTVTTPRNNNQTIVSNLFLFVTDVANILKDNFFTNSNGLSKQEEISNTTQTTTTEAATSTEAVTMKRILQAKLISKKTKAMNNSMSKISKTDSTSTENSISSIILTASPIGIIISTTTESIDIQKEKAVITSNQQPTKNSTHSAPSALQNAFTFVIPEAVGTTPFNDIKSPVVSKSTETGTTRSVQETDELKENETAAPNTNYVSMESWQQSTVTPRTESPIESLKPDVNSVKLTTTESFTIQKEKSFTTFNENPTNDLVSTAEETTAVAAATDAMENPIISNSSEINQFLINTILTSMQNTHTPRTQYNEATTTESTAYLIHQTRSVEAKNNQKIIKSTSVPSFTRPEANVHEKNKVFYNAVGGFIIGFAFLVLILYPLVYNGIKSIN